MPRTQSARDGATKVAQQLDLQMSPQQTQQTTQQTATHLFPGKDSRLGERLAWAIEQRRMTQRELTTRSGVQQQTISYLINSEVKRSRYASELGRALEVSMLWLTTGEGAPFNQIDRVSSIGGVQSATVYNTPLIKWSEIGRAIPEQHQNTLTERRYDFAVEVEGSSMCPDFKMGDRIFVDTAVVPEKNDYVLALVANECALRRYNKRIDMGKVIIEQVRFAPSSFTPDITGTEDDIKIVGVVMEKHTTLKKLSGAVEKGGSPIDLSRPNASTLAAIKAAKANRVTGACLDDL
jgi:SOS-response transcriptional repressor LexA